MTTAVIRALSEALERAADPTARDELSQALAWHLSADPEEES